METQIRTPNENIPRDFEKSFGRYRPEFRSQSLLSSPLPVHRKSAKFTVQFTVQRTKKSLNPCRKRVLSRTENPCVGGSIPPLSTNFAGFKKFG